MQGASHGQDVEPPAIEEDLEQDTLARHHEHRERVVGPFGCDGLANLELAFSRLFRDLLDGVVLEHQDALEERPPLRNAAPALDLCQGAILEWAYPRLPHLQILQPGNERPLGRELY